MSNRLPVAMEARTRLQRVENLLDQAFQDLRGTPDSSSPGSDPFSQCPAVLAAISNELQSFASLLPELEREPADRAALLPQLKALLPRFAAVERLLMSAAEFYRGWCAAAPAPGYPTPGYPTEVVSRNPALLALEG